MIVFSDRTVGRSFREAVAREIPGLGSNKAYWGLLKHLLFGTWRDEDNGLLLIPTDFLASIEGKRPDWNYCGRDFLRRFQKDTGIHIDVQDYQHHPDRLRAKCRQVKSVELPQTVLTLVAEERKNQGDEDRVWLIKGTKSLRKHVVEMRKHTKEQADALSSKANWPQQKLIHYLNNLPANRFSSTLQHWQEAYDVALQIESEESRNSQIDVLCAIRDQSQPFYKAVEKTTRIFALNESLLMLKSDLRKLLTQDWIEADLKYAQFAIVAKVWGIPSIEEYLRDCLAEGRSIWTELIDFMGFDQTRTSKSILKDALYALTFGMGDHKLKEQFRGSCPGHGAEAFKRFKNHPLIRDLRRARSSQLRRIRESGGGTDAFGGFIPIGHFQKDGRDLDTSRSILACIAQSYELMLLMPVINLAIEQQFYPHGFTICAWQHDGFSFDTFKNRDGVLWMNRLSQAVKERAEALGIMTELEFSS